MLQSPNATRFPLASKLRILHTITEPLLTTEPGAASLFPSLGQAQVLRGLEPLPRRKGETGAIFAIGLLNVS